MFFRQKYCVVISMIKYRDTKFRLFYFAVERMKWRQKRYTVAITYNYEKSALYAANKNYYCFPWDILRLEKINLLMTRMTLFTLTFQLDIYY